MGFRDCEFWKKCFIPGVGKAGCGGLNTASSPPKPFSSEGLSEPAATSRLEPAVTGQDHPEAAMTGWNRLEPAVTSQNRLQPVQGTPASPHRARAQQPAPHDRCPTCARGREPGLRVLFLNMCGENVAFPPAAAIWDVRGRKGICSEVPLPCCVASLSGFLKVTRSIGGPSDVR